LQAADLKISAEHRATFLVVASHWNGVANDCDGQRHPWTEWCHARLEPNDSPLALSPFVAHFIATYLPDVADPKKVAEVYTRKPAK
jgi:hypothetical protein